ncbi:MAG: C40 family peptidase [Lapillicoccus sp.]
MRVVVPVTTLWVSPDRPRAVDAPAVADVPDHTAWLAALDRHPDDGVDGDGRLGLHGRTLTQAVAGEPVLLDDAPDAYRSAPRRASAGWVPVVLPWQPSSLDPRGYPGWLRRAHLIPDDTGGHGDGPEDDTWAARPGPDGRADLAFARAHLGLGYLWGGTSPEGLDCSGLVHTVHRELGRLVPRDAHDQQAVCVPVPLEEVQPGDLYFFARDGRPAHHVGMVTGPGRMIHASEGRVVVEEDLDDARRATLVAAGRMESGAPARL